MICSSVNLDFLIASASCWGGFYSKLERNQGLRSIGAPAKIDPIGTLTRPALVTLPGQLLMAWRGVQGDDALYFSTFDGNAWENQTQPA
jgi:hypothetical protein